MMAVGAFLRWLRKGSGPQVDWLFYQFLCSLGFLLEHGPWMLEASEGHLQAPLPKAGGQLRNISQHVKEAVAQAAGEGTLGQSGRAVLQSVARCLRRSDVAGMGTGNDFITHRVARYWEAAQEMGSTPGVSIFSLAWDATRAGRQDMLYAALDLPQLGLACWLPPQAPVARLGPKGAAR
eukprot:2237659-Lingulodinium_polyedra.AAC.1